MLKETELWFKSLRQQDHPISNQKRKCWSLSRSLPELAGDTAEATRIRQYSQESRLRRRTVQVQRRLEALVEQGRRQTALLLRRQQRAADVQRFLRQPVAAPPPIYDHAGYERNMGGHICYIVSEPSCRERPAWWHSNPDLSREPCPAPTRPTCCSSRCNPPKQTAHECQPPPLPPPPPAATARKGILKPSSQVIFDPGMSQPADTDRTVAGGEPPCADVPQKAVWTGADGGAYVYPTADHRPSSPAGGMATVAFAAETPFTRTPSAAEGGLLQTSHVTADSPSLTCQDTRDFLPRMSPTAGEMFLHTTSAQVGPRSQPAQALVRHLGAEVLPSASCSTTSDRCSHPCCRGSDGADQLAVVGHQSLLNPRASGQKKVTCHSTSDKTLSDAKRPLAIHDKSSLATEEPSIQSAEPCKVNTGGSNIEARGRFEEAGRCAASQISSSRAARNSSGLSLAAYSREEQQASPEGQQGGHSDTKRCAFNQEESGSSERDISCSRSATQFIECNPRSDQHSTSSRHTASLKRAKHVVILDEESEPTEPEPKNLQIKDERGGNDGTLDFQPTKEETDETEHIRRRSQENVSEGHTLEGKTDNGMEKCESKEALADHNAHKTNPGHGDAIRIDSGDNAEHQRAFFIDITAEENCMIRSLSGESATFRGNRTLLLRQLLSQQKIDGTERRRRTSPQRHTQRRQTNAGRRDTEVVVGAMRQQFAREERRYLPVLSGSNQIPLPLVTHCPKQAYLDVFGNLTNPPIQGYGGDAHHRGGLPLVHLRHGDPTRNQSECKINTYSSEITKPKLTTTVRTPSNKAPADQIVLRRVNLQQTPWTDSPSCHCSGFHRPVHTEHDTSHSSHSNDDRYHADHIRKITHGSKHSLAASHFNDRGYHSSCESSFHFVSNSGQASSPTVSESQHISPEVVSDVCASEADATPNMGPILSAVSATKSEEQFPNTAIRIGEKPETLFQHTTKSHQHTLSSSPKPNQSASSKTRGASQGAGTSHSTNGGGADSREERSAELTCVSAVGCTATGETGPGPTRADRLEGPGPGPTRADRLEGPGPGPTRADRLEGFGPGPTRADRLEGAARPHRGTDPAVTSHAADSLEYRGGQADRTSTPATVTGTPLPSASEVTSRPDRSMPQPGSRFTARPRDKLVPQSAPWPRDALMPQSARRQVSPPTNQAERGPKHWTSVTLVSPQDMEMSLSLTTHLPSIAGRRREQRTHHLPSHIETKGLSGADPPHPR